MLKILIIGATSAIAQAVARQYCKQPVEFFLVARNQQRLNAVAQDLQVRGGVVKGTMAIDLADHEQHQVIVEQAKQGLGQFNIILIAHGTLSNQMQCQENVAQALQEINTNAISVISLATIIANVLEQQQQGTLVVISSVAGDIGRQSNYIYGAAKAMITTFLQGLTSRLHKANVNVLTVKPGFVDTPMTANFKKSFIWAKPKKVAQDICRAVKKRKTVLYTPWFWYWIMLIFKHIPAFVLKRLKI